MTKYILIPEFAPLHAMKRCFGRDHGPLKQPAKVPVDIIGMLLMQTGKEKVTIYEVKELPSKNPRKKEFSAPVLLTKENYRLPYDEIIGAVSIPTASMMTSDTLPKSEPVAVAPVVVPSSPEPEVSENLVVETTESEVKTDENNIPAKPVVEVEPEQTPVVTETAPEPPVEVVKEEAVTETPVVEAQPNPYAGMTKAERRAARRAAALAAEEAAAKSNDTTFEDEPHTSNKE